MGEATKIQWTDHTFNPWRGCTKVSPGCTNCYADAASRRNPKVLGVWGDNGTRVVASDAMWREPTKWHRQASEADKRRRVFCASLADVFEDRADLVVPRTRLWREILYTPSLDWLLLTKRPENVIPALKAVHAHQREHGLRDDCLAAWIDGSHPPDNAWLGASVENQETADQRIPVLLSIPAKVRFLSMEPLLGPVDLSVDWIGMPTRDRCRYFDTVESLRCGEKVYHRKPYLDWVIIGGESGPKARPCDLAWIRSIRDQCQAAGVAVFVKQLGARPQNTNAPIPGVSTRIKISLTDPKGGNPDEWPEDLRVREFPREAPTR